jgi:hypothetical protein
MDHDFFPFTKKTVFRIGAYWVLLQEFDREIVFPHFKEFFFDTFSDAHVDNPLQTQRFHTPFSGKSREPGSCAYRGAS